jgi:hypothetical protein
MQDPIGHQIPWLMLVHCIPHPADRPKGIDVLAVAKRVRSVPRLWSACMNGVVYRGRESWCVEMG